jgi:putative salt-induced outer membrane protein YdiY
MRFVNWIVVGVALLCPPLAAAQTPTPPPPPPRDIIDARVDFSFVNATGNSSAETIGAGGDVWVRPGSWAFRNKGALVRSQSRGIVTARSLTYLSRIERPVGRVFAFGQYDLLVDRLAGTAARNGLIAGVEWKAIGDKKARHELSAYAGAGWARETPVATAGETESHEDSAVGNAGWAYAWRFGTGSELKDDLRTELALDQPADWRLAHTISLTAALNTRLALKISSAIRYVNQPNPGFRTTDTTTSAGIVIKF